LRKGNNFSLLSLSDIKEKLLRKGNNFSLRQ
jgi:hypothetical protein